MNSPDLFLKRATSTITDARNELAVEKLRATRFDFGKEVHKQTEAYLEIALRDVLDSAYSAHLCRQRWARLRRERLEESEAR